MSWQQYVDSNLVGTGKVTKGAIHGHNGALWATSKGFNVSTQEINDLFQAYTDPSGVRANGLHVGSVKHICIKADDRSVYGKKVWFNYFSRVSPRRVHVFTTYSILHILGFWWRCVCQDKTSHFNRCL